MRDLSQIEREFREYERKIQRLKPLERELNSLDTKGFESEVRAIRSKIKDPDKVNQVEREISALKQKIEAKERKRKEAVKAIDTAKSTLQKAKGFGLSIIDSERLLNEAKSLLGKGDYAKAIERANRSKGIAETEIDKKFKQSREETLNAIGKAQSTLQNAKKLGISTKSDEGKLNNAKLKLNEKDFSNATKLAKECRSGLDRKITEYKQAAERSAKQSLDFAYSKMKEAERLGINVSSAQDLHRKAIPEFDNREYEKAIEYAEKCKKAAENEISGYNHAKEQIRASKDIVENVKRFVSIPKVIDLIKNAEAALEIGNYNSAFKLAKQAEGDALKFKQDYERYKETSEFVSSVESEISRIKKSGVKIPKSTELIKQTKSELNKNNFERAKELSKEAKREASERKSGYNLAFKSISESERILNETKNKGVIISSNLLTKSKQAFDNGDYEESVKSAEELKKLVNNREIKYREARDWINSAEFAIEKAKEFGCDVFEAEELLNRTRTGFEEGSYAQAISDAGESEKVAKGIKEKSKPEIEVDLPEKTFQPNVWEEISLNIFNKGNAHAKDIEIGLSEEVKVKDLEIIRSLNAGEKKDLAVSFKPVEVGRVPLEISTRFKDLEEKGYEDKRTVHINVGEIKGYEIPTEKKERALTIERAIYDPCKGDFVERRLPRMKKWINRYDPGAYWFAISIQNNTDRAIEEWDVDLEMSSALKVDDAKIEGIEREIPHEAHLKSFKISVPEVYGTTIPKGGAQRVYFKLRAEKPKTTYEISGVFKSKITGDVPIRAKEFKYLCDVRMSPEAVKPELKKTFSEKDAARLALSFKTVQEIDRMCNQDTKTEEYLDKLSVLKNYTGGFSEKFSKQLEDFSRFMKEEQLEYLDDKYKGKVRRFCTNLVDVWISEFLRG